jgi:hypothetical protein
LRIRFVYGVMSMAFMEIEILTYDKNGIDPIPNVDGQVMAPYVLNDAPPKEWKHYFETPPRKQTQ